MTLTADVRLHSVIERTLAQTPRRYRSGRFAKKPKPRDIITTALRAEYGAKSATASLDAIPLPVQHLEQPIEAVADSFFTPMMIIHLILGVACMAVGWFHPDINVYGRIVYESLGITCLYMAYRCAP